MTFRLSLKLEPSYLDESGESLYIGPMTNHRLLPREGLSEAVMEPGRPRVAKRLGGDAKARSGAAEFIDHMGEMRAEEEGDLMWYEVFECRWNGKPHTGR